MTSPPQNDAGLPPAKRRKKAGVQFLARVLAPRLYRAYIGLVEWTSRVDKSAGDKFLAPAARGDGALVLMLHQGIVVGPYLFRHRGITTLASVGDSGEIITGFLEDIGYTVFRGGSSRGRSRRTSVMGDIIEYAEQHKDDGYTFVVTPDGSRGPFGHVKPGVPEVARRTGAEVFCLHVQSSRAYYLKTWDRTGLPLPFGRIKVFVSDPFTVPPDADAELLEQTRLRLEAQLDEIHREAFAWAGRAPVPSPEERKQP